VYCDTSTARMQQAETTTARPMLQQLGDAIKRLGEYLVEASFGYAYRVRVFHRLSNAPVQLFDVIPSRCGGRHATNTGGAA
jgi:hypothetical protein